MLTQYVSTIPLNAARLEKDLAHSRSFRYSEAYSNYLIGGPWKSCMLWSAGGDTGDGLLSSYTQDRGSSFTEYGQQVSYLQEIITSVADLTRLRFARLAVFSKSVIVPHRDFIELGDVPEDARCAHRLHIPLATNDECFFSQGNTVYRMLKGEVWHFDATQIHSVASFSEDPRIHLIFDFVDRPEPRPLVTIENEGNGGIPAERIVSRPQLGDDARANLLGLSCLLTKDTFAEIFGIVVKTEFRYDGGKNFAWETITEIAGNSKDPQVLAHVLELRRYYTLERPTGSGKA